MSKKCSEAIACIGRYILLRPYAGQRFNHASGQLFRPTKAIINAARAELHQLSFSFSLQEGSNSLSDSYLTRSQPVC